LKKIGNYYSTKRVQRTFSAADIHISPDGKFLYATNRGEANNIDFKILNNGKLYLQGQTSTLGKDLEILRLIQQNFLLVANQFTNE
jgi:6-phosphogluconolactonase